MLMRATVPAERACRRVRMRLHGGGRRRRVFRERLYGRQRRHAVVLALPWRTGMRMLRGRGAFPVRGGAADERRIPSVELTLCVHCVVLVLAVMIVISNGRRGLGYRAASPASGMRRCRWRHGHGHVARSNTHLVINPHSHRNSSVSSP